MMDWNDWSENVSDETLAAFIDGNATAEEAAFIQRNMGHDELLAEAIDVVHDTVSLGCYDWSILVGDFEFLELGLPPIITEDSLEFAGVQEDFNDMEESYESDSLDVLEDDWLTSDDLTSDDSLDSDVWDGMDDIFS